MIQEQDRLIVALDNPDLASAEETVRRLSGRVGCFKVGKELFTAAGPDAVRMVARHGGRVFLDLKFHDIPNTVAGAVRSAAKLGVWMCNVHAQGGEAMMRAAAEEARAADGRMAVVAVTILTSLDQEALREIGWDETPEAAVVRLARLAHRAGLRGVVASSREAQAIREACGAEFWIVTPGVRPAGAHLGDQKRVLTPREAIHAGADYLVVGRPITAAVDPAAAAAAVCAEIREAVKTH